MKIQKSDMTMENVLQFYLRVKMYVNYYIYYYLC